MDTGAELLQDQHIHQASTSFPAYSDDIPLARSYSIYTVSRSWRQEMVGVFFFHVSILDGRLSWLSNPSLFPVFLSGLEIKDQWAWTWLCPSIGCIYGRLLVLCPVTDSMFCRFAILVGAISIGCAWLWLGCNRLVAFVILGFRHVLVRF